MLLTITFPSHFLLFVVLRLCCDFHYRSFKLSCNQYFTSHFILVSNIITPVYSGASGQDHMRIRTSSRSPHQRVPRRHLEEDEYWSIVFSNIDSYVGKSIFRYLLGKQVLLGGWKKYEYSRPPPRNVLFYGPIRSIIFILRTFEMSRTCQIRSLSRVTS